MPTVTEAISNLFAARRAAHNGPDLLDRWTPGMETQINVAADGGSPVDGKNNTYTDGVRQWHPIRIPKHADSEPEFNDWNLSWSLAEHASAIGCTGWDWQERVSRWVAFDFDSISGHGIGVGISDSELEAVKQAAIAVPWVEVRKSTGGAGLHFYVYFDEPVPTANHTEHAALARAVLSILSREAAFDFAAQIDVCGGNMWIWHRKANAENEGLKIIKPAAVNFTDVPANWRDHVDVVTRKRRKVKIVEPSEENNFEALATSRKFVPLDAKHRQIIDRLVELGHPAVWVGDYHLLQTHTLGLKALADEYDFGIAGFFETTSSGSTPINCFCFPLPDGAWKVCRFGAGVREADTWEQDGTNYTWCFFNRAPSLAAACKALGASELENKQGWQFDHAREALRAIVSLGEKLELDPAWFERRAILKANDDGRLVVRLERKELDQKPGVGWVDKPGWWSKIFQTQTGGAAEDENDMDQFLRVVMTPKGSTVGLFVASEGGRWDRHNASMAKMYLQSSGYSKSKAETLIGDGMKRRWQLVSMPFKAEYPGSRQWNMDAPQLRIKPAENRENLRHPHWDSLYEHCGRSLTPFLADLDWAQRANITTGGDYLKAWFATIIREPWARLPFLFLHGPENCGKTTLWESFRECIVTHGVVKADKAITSKGDFCAELDGCVLAVVEEKNIAESPGALAKIRDYVTAREISIHKKFVDPYSVPNTTHWLQTSNYWDACPIANGDTRITAFDVAPLPAGSEIPKDELLAHLTAEAPAFLRTLLDFQLPTPMGRLRIPVVETETKKKIAAKHASPLEEFLSSMCFAVPGSKLLASEFVERFLTWLPETERHAWTRHTVLKNLPPHVMRGTANQNKTYLANLSFENTPTDDTTPYRVVDGKLVRGKDE